MQSLNILTGQKQTFSWTPNPKPPCSESKHAHRGVDNILENWWRNRASGLVLVLKDSRLAAGG